jgi:glycosyltransferase involved in cell wall biosynthesis
MTAMALPDVLKEKKIALVHDFLLCPGGAEKTLEAIAEIFPDAPIYTILYDKAGMRGMLKGRDIRPSFVQKFPAFLRRRYRRLTAFFPSAVEAFDLRDFDVVISSSGAWSKGIVTKLKTRHIAFIHSPMRYVWDYNERYWKERGRTPGVFTRLFITYLRQWDRLAADRPEALIANSLYTLRRIEKYYRRSAVVVYPPVDLPYPTSDFAKGEKKGSFVIVSRLHAYKRLDIVIDAFNKLNLPLVIIGEGPEKRKLRQIAGPNILITGWQREKTIAQRYYRDARAFIFSCEDDFGIAPVEAMRHGIPVIAYRAGGAVETVEEGVSGEFFDAQTAEVLSDAVRRFLEKEDSYDRRRIAEAASRFSKRDFQRHFIESCDRILSGIDQDSNR